MALVTKAIKGTQDILPSEVYKNQFIESTMLEIAENTGFNSSTHFCGCFKEAVGCSPSQYRKEKRPIII